MSLRSILNRSPTIALSKAVKRIKDRIISHKEKVKTFKQTVLEKGFFTYVLSEIYLD
jgi:hypothetical protein